MEAQATESPASGPSRRNLLEALIPAGVLVARLVWAETPPWLDWLIVLPAYWLLHLLLSKSRAMPAVTAATMIALFGIYLVREFPRIVEAYNLCR